MRNWLKRIETLPKQAVVLVCILFITVVGLLDFATGYETFFFTFYLLAIFAGTWRVNTLFGTLLSALSVTAWVSANLEAGAQFSNYFIPVWNAAIMFTIYLIIVALLTRLKRIHEELEERVRLRTMALTREIQERRRLQKALLEAGEQEQRRIARELHDGLGQHLTGTALAGHLLAKKLASGSPAEAAEAARLVRLVEEGIEMTRDLSHQFDPVELKSGQLKDQLEDLAVDTRQRHKVDCQLEYPLTSPVENPTATHLFHIARGAVSAALKQKGVKRIRLSLKAGAKDLVLTITDDGTPASADQAEAGDAIRSLTYRADLIGAVLKREKSATGGSQLTCVLPFSGSIHGV
jgi:signal transduction histidine kinase